MSHDARVHPPGFVNSVACCRKRYILLARQRAHRARQLRANHYKRQLGCVVHLSGVGGAEAVGAHV
jgi:hypothetical protein